MALMEYYCMPADFKVQILEEEELYDDHSPLWEDLSEMLGGEVLQLLRRGSIAEHCVLWSWHAPESPLPEQCSESFWLGNDDMDVSRLRWLTLPPLEDLKFV